MLEVMISGQPVFVSPADVTNIAVNLSKGTIDVNIQSEGSNETVKVRSVHEDESPKEMIMHCLNLMDRLGGDVKITGSLDITNC